MATLQIYQFPCLSDNFGVLIHDPEASVTASIDAPEAGKVAAALKEKGWKLTHILTTHHHADHTDRQRRAQGRDRVHGSSARATRPARCPASTRRWARATRSRSARTRCRCWTRRGTPPGTSPMSSRRPRWRSSATRCSPSAAAG